MKPWSPAPSAHLAAVHKQAGQVCTDYLLANGHLTGCFPSHLHRWYQLNWNCTKWKNCEEMVHLGTFLPTMHFSEMCNVICKAGKQCRICLWIWVLYLLSPLGKLILCCPGHYRLSSFGESFVFQDVLSITIVISYILRSKSLLSNINWETYSYLGGGDCVCVCVNRYILFFIHSGGHHSGPPWKTG